MTVQCTKCQETLSADARFCRSCGALVEGANVAAADPWIGRLMLDRYRITEVLGEGGMGRVYLAEQRMGTTTRAVAVKTLRPALGADAHVVRRFYREAETVVQLTHPNTIQFFDFGELPDGTLAIVMEYVNGRSLAEEILAHGSVDPMRVDRILAQACGSLAEAHHAGIIHRDLKPDNILLTVRGGQEDFVKVLDFGIAMSHQPDAAQTRLTQQGMVVGTPPYMSPEQFSGETLDARSDVYSLAIVCYEMLSGKLPFEAKTAWEWASQHLTAPPARLPIAGAEEVMARKASAIAHALEKTPADRPASILDFMTEFTGFDDPRMVFSGAGASTSTPRATAASSVRPRVSPAATPTGTQALPRSGDGSRFAMWGGGIFALVVFGLGFAWFHAGRDLEELTHGETVAMNSLATAPAVQGPRAAEPPPRLPSSRPRIPEGLAPPEDKPEAEAAARPKRRRRARPDREVPARVAEPAGVPEQPPSRSASAEAPKPRTVAEPSPVVDAAPPVEPEVRPAEAPAGLAADAEEVAATPDPPVEWAPLATTRTAAVKPTKPIEATPTPVVRRAHPKTVAVDAEHSRAAAASAKEIEKLARSNQFNRALGRYRAAVHEYGANEPSLRRVRDDLEIAGAREITNYLQRAKCPQAHSVYRALRSAELRPPSADTFSGTKCRKP